MTPEERLGYASVVMAMSRDYWVGKINWEHYVTTLRFTAQKIYDESMPLHDPYIGAPSAATPEGGPNA